MAIKINREIAGDLNNPSSELLNYCISKHQESLSRLQKLSDYYDGKQDILKRTKDNAAAPNNKLLIKQLQAIGIPSDLAARIQGNTAEEAMEDVKSFKAEWDLALKTAVDAALVSSVDTPLGGGATNNTVNPFSKDTLNLTEQGRLLREDPEKAKALQALAKK